MGDRSTTQAKAKAETRPGADLWRWLAMGLVVAAVLLIVAIKGLRPSSTGGLAIADTSATAVGPTLQAPAATAAQPQSGALPADPAGQVDWVLANKKAALILFHSTNCKPCIAMTALVDKIRPDYAEKIVFVDVVTNDSANAALVRRAGIQSIPTTFFITTAGTGHGYIGLMKEEDVRAELDKLVMPE